LFLYLFHFAQDHEPYGYEPNLLFKPCQCADYNQKVFLIQRLNCLSRALLDISKHLPCGGYDDCLDAVLLFTLAFFGMVCLFCLGATRSLPVLLRCLFRIIPADFAGMKTQCAVMAFFLVEGDENAAFGFKFPGKLCFLVGREVVPCAFVRLGFWVQ
jgi:hypothetical protein